MTKLWALLLMLAMALVACDRAPERGADPLGIGTQELRFEMPQRTTTTVPGVMGRISLKLGDVETATGVEDLAVIDHKDESSVGQLRAMKKSQVLGFDIDGVGYVLQLADYDASHVLSDTATFTLRKR